MTTPLRFGDMYSEAADALKPLPDGEYAANVSDAEATKSQNDKPMIKVKLAVKKPGGGVKMVQTQLVVSSENSVALAIFFRHMEAFGLGSAFWTNDTTLEQAAAAMRGRTVRVVLATREWNGQPRNEVTNWLAPLGGLQTGPVAAPTVLGNGPAPAGPAGPQVAQAPVGSPVPTAPTPTPTPPTGAQPVAF